jgi:hypothetical protein
MVGKLVMGERRVWRNMSESTPCDKRSFIAWMISWNPRELDGNGRAQGDEALEGAEGNDDNFGLFR